MNHRDFLRTLSNEEKRVITAKTNSHAIYRVLLLLTLLLVSSFCIVSQMPFWQVMLPIQGLLLISLFHLEHECIHDTPFKHILLNKTVAFICGLVLFLPSEWFRYFHRDHHRYTHIEGKDPELASAKPETKKQWLLHLSGFTVYKSLLVIFWNYSLTRKTETFIPLKAQTEVVRQIQLMCLIYFSLWGISLWSKSPLLLILWIIPLLLGQPFLRMYLLAEHTLCDHDENMFRNTRTVVSHPIVRWFTWNMPYHTEHHVYPAVPFHQLPKLHQKMHQYLKHNEKSYTGFNQRLYRKMS